MDRIENILPALADPSEFKKSFLSDFTMLSVTAAIIAQVAITALALQNLSQVHWTANAEFIVSLVNAVLSVWTSTTASRFLTSLDTKESLRDWLCNPAPKAARQALEKLLASKVPNIDNATWETLLEAKQDVLAFIMANKWNRASFYSSFILTIPSVLLNYSLAAFFVALGIYLGSVWKDNLNAIAGSTASRAVLICFVVSVSLGMGLFFQASSMKDSETSSLRGWLHAVNSNIERLDAAPTAGRRADEEAPVVPRIQDPESGNLFPRPEDPEQ